MLWIAAPLHEGGHWLSFSCTGPQRKKSKAYLSSTHGLPKATVWPNLTDSVKAQIVQVAKPISVPSFNSVSNSLSLNNFKLYKNSK